MRALHHNRAFDYDGPLDHNRLFDYDGPFDHNGPLDNDRAFYMAAPMVFMTVLIVFAMVFIVSFATVLMVPSALPRIGGNRQRAQRHEYSK